MGAIIGATEIEAQTGAVRGGLPRTPPIDSISGRDHREGLRTQSWRGRWLNHREDAVSDIERIGLQRNVAIVRADSIQVRPARAQLLAPVIEIGLALGAVALISQFLDSLPIALLALLLGLATLLGPIGVVSLVFGIVGSHVIADSAKQSVRWQQGFLGLGIGTMDVVPFSRIDHFRVTGDYDEELTAGGRQDIVQWDVQLVKDNERVLDIGTVPAARPLADVALERANRLATAFADLCGVEAKLAELPVAASAATDGEDEPPRPRRRVERDALPPPSETAASERER